MAVIKELERLRFDIVSESIWNSGMRGLIKSQRIKRIVPVMIVEATIMAIARRRRVLRCDA